MPHRTGTKRRGWMNRALSLLLAAVLLAGMAPGLTMPASAHWADQYLDQLVDWGVMRADQTSDPDKPMTRAEFMAVINRAYGYTEMGEIPFTDVHFNDWFYDDVAIAYTAGYMAGTSETTASPNLGLTREQAVCILARNMMLKDTPGENLAFADAREISGWARGLVRTAVDNYIVSGYPDNTFGAQDSVSKGQVAALVVRCLGNPLNTPGEHVLGDVFDNVTITSPNVTLRNTTISGDLYVSGGVGLGGIKLENVKVLGRIIVSGTGESEAGDASVVMRNVTADEMLVDNMRNKAVTIRADGITEIENTIVRTQAYLEDNNTDDKGLMNITLEGEPGTQLTLAGRIKDVVNKTPSSTVQVAKGTVKKLTVDEAATNSVVQIDRNTKVKELNLDVATSVVGEGDIDQLNVNAPGCVVSMLPDKIYIRPGLTANIAGVIMDHVAAEEGSIDPRLLSGYPAARDIAPTAFRADFSTNKKGTVYWAVSTISDGSIGEDNLISPPSYGSKALRNGSVAAATGGTEISAQVTGLTTGGSYYLSAILVDDQNQRSPVKVISFSTPDNTVPAFGQGYPYMSLISRDVAQVTVMPTKSCKLYYALLPQGAQAPTVNNLKSASVTGNLGYGVRDVTKNTEEVFTVNNQRLEELKNYTLYLWLTDVDGANSSAIQSLPVPVPDETPPVVDPAPYSVAQGTTGNTIAMRSGMNETGTIFWAVVPQGDPYPLPNMQSDPLDRDNIMNEDNEAVKARLNSDYAKLGVSSGRGSLTRGQVAVSNPDNEVSFNVTGLQPETAYDLYYVGRDTAGNFSDEVKMVTVTTQDTAGPVVSQYFINPDRSTCTELPPANASIVLDFSERITVDGTKDILDSSMAATLGKKLQANFVLHQLDPMNPSHEMEITDVTDLSDETTPTKAEAKAAATAWIDYTQVKAQESKTNQGHVEVVFTNGEAVSLASGRTYFFSLENIRDTSGNYPPGANNTEIKIPLTYRNTEGTPHSIPQFSTAFASVSLNDRGTAPQPVWAKDLGAKEQGMKGAGMNGNNQLARMDTFFTVSPESTENMSDETCYDIVLFADQSVGYDLYYRIIDTRDNNKVLNPGAANGKFEKYKLPSSNSPVTGETNGWVYLGNYNSELDRRTQKAASAINKDFNKVGVNFPSLNKLGEGLRYEFAISVTSKDGDDRYEAWNDAVSFDVYVMAGAARNLNSGMLGTYTPESLTTEWSIQSIGIPNPPGYITIKAPFSDSIEPLFRTGSPNFVAGDTFETMNFELNPTGSTLYYRMALTDESIPSKIKVLKEVKYEDGDGNGVTIPASTDATPTILDSSVDKEKFYQVIKKQTDLDENRGQLGSTGKLTYYEVVDTDKSFRKAIASMNNSYPNNFPGSVVYDWANGAKPARLPDRNSAQQLKPDKDYYIYIVLESASGNKDSLSQVYIYTFKTSQTAKPKINLQDGRNGTVEIITQVPAALRYIMLTPTGIQDTVFTETSWRIQSGLTLPAAYQGYSVIDAMMEVYSSQIAGTGQPGSEYDGYSVFDIYADDTVKTRVARAIRNTSSGDAIPGATETDGTSIPVVEPQDTSKMKPGENYYFITVGYNTSGEEGTGDSFAALENIRVPNRIVPYVTSINTAVKQYGSSGDYGGYVTVNFSAPLYWVPDGTSTAAIPVVDRKPSSPAATTWKSVFSDLGGGAAYKLYSKNSTGTAASSSFTFYFDTATTGSGSLMLNEGFMIFNTGRIANSGGYNTPNKIAFTMFDDVTGNNGAETHHIKFRATWIDETGIEHSVEG